MRTIQLLHKAGLLIDELAHGSATHAELAKALNEPRSSIYRIVASLEEAGYVHQVGGGHIDLDVSILRLGDSAVSALVNRHGLREQLRWIREQLGMSAFFCALQDDRIICLDQVQGSDVDLIYLVPGKTLPQHAGAASHVLLAYGPAAIQERILNAYPYAQISPKSPSTSRELLIQLELAKQQGWSFDDGELAEGVATVAVPVLSDNGELVGTVAVAGLRSNLLSRKETIREVLATASTTIAQLRIMATSTDSTAQTSSNEREEDDKSPSVIAKAAALMSALEAEKAASSVHIAELLGEPVSSVYRMLHTLTQAGWVEQDGPRGTYRVGLKMLSLSEALLQRMDIRRIAAPVMQQIHALTGETTFLCIRHGARAVCIERLDGIRVNSRVLQLGTSLPLHIGAAPRALLAFDDRTAWDEYANTLETSGQNWQNDPSRVELFRHLEEDRNQGFVLVDDEITPGIAAVGAPIYTHRGEIVASLSLSGLREGILAQPEDEPSASDLISNGAHQISRALGATVGDFVPPEKSPLTTVS